MEKGARESYFFSPSIIMGLPGQVLYLAACKRLSCAFVFLSKPLQTAGRIRVGVSLVRPLALISPSTFPCILL